MCIAVVPKTTDNAESILNLKNGHALVITVKCILLPLSLFFYNISVFNCIAYFFKKSFQTLYFSNVNHKA